MGNSFLDKTLAYIGLTVKKRDEKDPDQTITTPPTGGRSSTEDVDYIRDLVSEYEMQPDVPFELLEGLQKLAMYNPDVSYAVDNIKQLGSTKYNVYFSEEVPETLRKEMLKELDRASKKWYSNGTSSLVKDLMAQVAISGCISAEVVPNRVLDDGVEKVVLVNASNIRFKYDKATDSYRPFQKVNNLFATNGLKELNPVTYRYHAMSRYNSKPYAIPPLLSGIEALGIERDMMTNFRTLIKKLGFLGFLNVLVQKPAQLPGEADITYNNRLKTYLDTITGNVKSSLANGFVVGYKNSHEFKMENTAANVPGSEKLFNINETLKMSGLKQDPMMLGRNLNSTEAFARVIITKLSSQIMGYQQVVAEFMEYMFLMHLYLKGYPVDNVTVEFTAPLLSDQLREAQTRTAEISNCEALFQQGVISQEQRAQELGYEEAFQEEPRPPVMLNPQGDPADEGDSEPVEKGAKVSNAAFMLGAKVTEFKYGAEPAHKDNYFYARYALPYSLSEGTELLAEKLSEYYNATAENYGKAAVKVTKAIAAELAALSESVTLTEFTDTVISTLYKNWGDSFTKPQRAIVSKFVESSYRAFRKDKTPFGSDFIAIDGKKTPIPAATFNLLDQRAISYYKESDSLYLGKFITDADTKRKLTEFLKEQYLGDNRPIGKNIASISSFREAFPELLRGEEWKIARVINTTVNKMRNNAAVAYMDQAGLTQYQIVELNDRLTCEWCRSMHGRTFSIASSMAKADALYASSPTAVSLMAPFVNTVYKKAEELEKVSDAELQKAGIDTPAFHPSCRGVIKAMF